MTPPGPPRPGSPGVALVTVQTRAPSHLHVSGLKVPYSHATGRWLVVLKGVYHAMQSSWPQGKMSSAPDEV